MPFGHFTQFSTISTDGRSALTFSRLEIIVSMLCLYSFCRLRSVPMLMSATVTHAPRACSTERAACPTVPPPRISTFMPGAPPSPLTNLPLPPLIVSMDSSPIRAPCFPAASQFGEPYLCESSAVKAMTFLSRRACTSSGCAAGCIQVNTIWFSLRRSYSAGSNSFTLAIKPHVLYISSAVSVMTAPAAAYVSSGNPAF